MMQLDLEIPKKIKQKTPAPSRARGGTIEKNRLISLACGFRLPPKVSDTGLVPVLFPHTGNIDVVRSNRIAIEQACASSHAIPDPIARFAPIRSRIFYGTHTAFSPVPPVPASALRLYALRLYALRLLRICA